MTIKKNQERFLETVKYWDRGLLLTDSFGNYLINVLSSFLTKLISQRTKPLCSQCSGEPEHSKISSERMERGQTAHAA